MIDARRLAELLRLDHLTPVYHGEHGLRTMRCKIGLPNCFVSGDGRRLAILAGPGKPMILSATVCVLSGRALHSQRIDAAIKERMLAQIRPQAQAQSPLSGEAERDFLENATTDEMKAYFERKYLGGTL